MAQAASPAPDAPLCLFHADRRVLAPCSGQRGRGRNRPAYGITVSFIGLPAVEVSPAPSSDAMVREQGNYEARDARKTAGSDIAPSQESPGAGTALPPYQKQKLEPRSSPRALACNRRICELAGTAG